MQTYSDSTPGMGARVEYEPVRPVEIIPAVEAAQTFIREYPPGTIAHALHQSFIEADRRAAAGIFDQPLEQYTQEVFPSRAEAYRDFLHDLTERQHLSDAVKKVQNALKSDQPEISEFDITYIGEIYNRNFFKTLKDYAGQISQRDFQHLHESGRPQVTRGLRDVVTNRLVKLSQNWGMLPQLEGKSVLKEEAKNLGCLIGEVQYLDTRTTGQVVAMLRHAGTEQTEEQWTNDVRAIEQASYRSDYQQITDSPEFASIKPSLN